MEHFNFIFNYLVLLVDFINSSFYDLFNQITYLSENLSNVNEIILNNKNRERILESRIERLESMIIEQNEDFIINID
jgi:hypothetical protein